VGGIISFIVINLIGAWVKCFSRLFMPDGQYDYMSGYLLIFILGITACGLVVKLEINKRHAVIKERRVSDNAK